MNTSFLYIYIFPYIDKQCGPETGYPQADS